MHIQQRAAATNAHLQVVMGVEVGVRVPQVSLKALLGLVLVWN